MQRIDHADAKAANAQILDDLTNGANGITLVFEGAIGDHGYALPTTGTAISAALDEVYLDAEASDIDLGFNRRTQRDFSPLWSRPAQIAPSRNDHPLRLRSAERDGLGGGEPPSLEEYPALLAALVADLVSQGFAGPFAAADGRVILPPAARKRRTSPSPSQVPSPSPRAGARRHRARRCARDDLFPARRRPGPVPRHRQVPRDQEAVGAHRRRCGCKLRPAFVSAETAWRMMTKRDPTGHVRGTIAALGTVVGGTDAVDDPPVHAGLGLPERVHPACRSQHPLRS